MFYSTWTLLGTVVCSYTWSKNAERKAEHDQEADDLFAQIKEEERPFDEVLLRLACTQNDIVRKNLPSP